MPISRGFRADCFLEMSLVLLPGRPSGRPALVITDSHYAYLGPVYSWKLNISFLYLFLVVYLMSAFVTVKIYQYFIEIVFLFRFVDCYQSSNINMLILYVALVVFASITCRFNSYCFYDAYLLYISYVFLS